jgi:predicted nucleic-acid-binding Zn-ribbon protein
MPGIARLDTDQLSQSDKQKVLDWLNKRWVGSKSCGICGHNRWTLGDHLVAPVTSPRGGGMVIGGVTYPQVMVICNNCGHTHFFNAALIGLGGNTTTPKKPGGDVG